MMNKVLISIPDKIAYQMRAAMPQRQCNKVIVSLIEKEVQKGEKALYECALAVEQDHDLTKEMNEWNITIEDGLIE
jgi:hypothetical protein